MQFHPNLVMLSKFFIQSGLYPKKPAYTFDCSDQHSLDIHIWSSRFFIEMQSDPDPVRIAVSDWIASREPDYVQHL